MKSAFISQNQSEVLTVTEVCELFNLKKSSYYRWCSFGEKRVSVSKRKQLLTNSITRIFHESRQTYGSPRVWIKLSREGMECSRHEVATLMRENGLVSVHHRRKRKRITTTDSAGTSNPAPNILKRDFTCTAPNQKWVGDVTFIRTEEG